jgi:ABC-2 type transport system ATP-binding protein
LDVRSKNWTADRLQQAIEQMKTDEMLCEPPGLQNHQNPDSRLGKLLPRPSVLAKEEGFLPGLDAIYAPKSVAVGKSRPQQAAGTAEPIIKIQDLCVEYRSTERGKGPKLAVQKLSVAVQPGTVFGFLGPNGAGKTTTMNVLLGFTPASSGEAWLFGANVREPIARQRIGYLPELTYYYKFLTAEELLRFYARIFRIPKPERERRIDAVLKLVELETVRRRQIKTYSKGMQQRIGLAQALINDPDLLILDEPTSGLDPIGRMKVREVILRLRNEGKTVFFSSHELGEVETVCDRVAILSQGRLQVEGRVDELVQQHGCGLEQLFLKVIGFHHE